MTIGIGESVRMIGAFARAGLAPAPHLIRPHVADHAFLAGLTNVRVRPARSSVRLMPLIQAQENGPTALIAEGIRHPRSLRLSMTTFLVEHREARFLIDPAMCADVHDTVLTELAQPYRMAVAPERPVAGLAESLAKQCGLAPQAIDFVMPTHLHWDHIAGLCELPVEIAVQTQETERAFVLDGETVPFGVARGPLRDRKLVTYELDGPAPSDLHPEPGRLRRWFGDHRRSGRPHSRQRRIPSQHRHPRSCPDRRRRHLALEAGHRDPPEGTSAG